MNGNTFLDTNLFIYMQSASDPIKKELSYDALENFNCVVSTQILNEFCNVALKKLNMKPEQIIQVLLAIDNTCDLVVVTFETVKKALGLRERYGFHYYDALVVASALEYGCIYLFSEDMSDGQVVDGCLEIVNIFARPELVWNPTL